jgi:hypothetical protein
MFWQWRQLGRVPTDTFPPQSLPGGDQARRWLFAPLGGEKWWGADIHIRRASAMRTAPVLSEIVTIVAQVASAISVDRDGPTQHSGANRWVRGGDALHEVFGWLLLRALELRRRRQLRWRWNHSRYASPHSNTNTDANTHADISERDLPTYIWRCDDGWVSTQRTPFAG